MTDGVDKKDIAGFLGKADAVVADPKAQFAGLSPELLNVTLAGLSEAMECGEEAHSGVAVETADIGAGALGPDDSPHA